MQDGSAPASGTECEIGWALDHAGKNRGVPQLRVYRNCSKPTPPLEPKEEREAFGRQWDSVQEFFAHWEGNSEGDFAGVFNKYCNLQEFEELYRGRRNEKKESRMVFEKLKATFSEHLTHTSFIS